MDKNNPHRKHVAQKKYRTSQSHKGLVRFELQVSLASKQRFETMVQAAAEEFDSPWDHRQRMAKARAQIFDEITQGLKHEFTELQRQIKLLKEEIKALSPSYFKSDSQNQAPLPEAIAALPDDPTSLKNLIATLHVEKQQSMRAALQYKQNAKQFEQLYEVASNYNEELKRRLKVHEPL